MPVGRIAEEEILDPEETIAPLLEAPKLGAGAVG
jgi:hypothetical protein